MRSEVEIVSVALVEPLEDGVTVVGFSEAEGYIGERELVRLVAWTVAVRLTSDEKSMLLIVMVDVPEDPAAMFIVIGFAVIPKSCWWIRHAVSGCSSQPL